jgi:hypothetical protein
LNKIISLLKGLPDIPTNKQYTDIKKQLDPLINKTVTREEKPITGRERRLYKIKLMDPELEAAEFSE